MTQTPETAKALAEAQSVLANADLAADIERQKLKAQALREKTSALEDALKAIKLEDIQKLRSDIWRLIQELGEFR